MTAPAGRSCKCRTRDDQSNSGAIRTIQPRSLRDLLNFAGANAGGTDADAAASAVDHRANGLQIQIPAAFGDVMSVADAATELGTASTHFAYSCHDYKNLLEVTMSL